MADQSGLTQGERITLLVVAGAVIFLGAITTNLGVMALGLGLLGVPGFSSILTRHRNLPHETG